MGTIKSPRIRFFCFLLLLLVLLVPNSNGFYNPHFCFERPSQSALESFWRRPNDHAQPTQPITTTRLNMGKAVKISNDPWYPLIVDNDEEKQAAVERQAVQLCSQLIRRKVSGNTTIATAQDIHKRAPMIRNRFMDLACTAEGEAVLESLFDDDIVNAIVDNEQQHVLRAAVMVMQSLCVFGTQVGVKGTPEQLSKLVAHLDPRRDPTLLERDVYHWDADSVRRLKHQLEREPAVQLLAELKWKRTTQGAFDLLNILGAWSTHEDLALLRSGFPLRFSQAELDAAQEAAQSTHDVDEILGIRQDLRHLKVFTIDSACTSEIDDGLSVETFTHKDGSVKHRIWVHIADADRWAPRHSELFRTAQKRITSLYLPRATISMFPADISRDVMSLKTDRDSFALSLSAEINDDGSLDRRSISVTPSLIRVTYRLTYDEADEMLEEGIGYREEWELGALLDMARKRRNYRINKGSSESLIPNPIPFYSVSTFEDKTEIDEIGIRLKVEVSHNSGQNQTAEQGLQDSNSPMNPMPASSSGLLVTEAMILAGEAIGRFKTRLDRNEFNDSLEFPNQLRLPFRTQRPPDFKSRARERRVMEDLRDMNVGGGICYAWYARRFLLPVKVTEHAFPHSMLGLDVYVQWTSPIRRFSDLQTHTSVKRVLRRKRVAELVQKGEPIPSGLFPRDFGWPFAKMPRDMSEVSLLSHEDLDQDINFKEGVGLIGAARSLQRQSGQYWLFEYIDRANQRQSNLTYTAVVLGCVDPEKQQYAIYVYELALEHRYSSPCRLDPGVRLRLEVESVYPRLGLLTFVRAI